MDVLRNHIISLKNSDLLEKKNKDREFDNFNPLVNLGKKEVEILNDNNNIRKRKIFDIDFNDINGKISNQTIQIDDIKELNDRDELLPKFNGETWSEELKEEYEEAKKRNEEWLRWIEDYVITRNMLLENNDDYKFLVLLSGYTGTSSIDSLLDHNSTEISLTKQRKDLALKQQQKIAIDQTNFTLIELNSIAKKYEIKIENLDLEMTNDQLIYTKAIGLMESYSEKIKEYFDSQRLLKIKDFYNDFFKDITMENINEYYSKILELFQYNQYSKYIDPYTMNFLKSYNINSQRKSTMNIALEDKNITYGNKIVDFYNSLTKYLKKTISLYFKYYRGEMNEEQIILNNSNEPVFPFKNSDFYNENQKQHFQNITMKKIVFGYFDLLNEIIYKEFIPNSRIQYDDNKISSDSKNELLIYFKNVDMKDTNKLIQNSKNNLLFRVKDIIFFLWENRLYALTETEKNNIIDRKNYQELEKYYITHNGLYIKGNYDNLIYPPTKYRIKMFSYFKESPEEDIKRKNEDFIDYTLKLIINGISTEQKKRQDEINQFKNQLNLLNEKIIAREKGIILDLPKIPKEKYEHDLEWILTPQISGILHIAPNVISAIQTSYSKIIELHTNKSSPYFDQMKYCDKLGIDFFKYDKTISIIFAQIVSAFIIRGQENAFKQYRPNHVFKRNRIQSFDLYDTFFRMYCIKLKIDTFGNKVYFGANK